MARGGQGVTRREAPVAARTVLAAVAALALVLVALLAPAGAGGPQGVGAQSKRAAFKQFDPTLEVRPDGTFHITEWMVVNFTGGPFRGGERVIPMARTDAIEHVRVAEQRAFGSIPLVEDPNVDETDAPGRFAIKVSGHDLTVTWGFDPVSDDTRTFVLEYDVLGALRAYPDETPPNEQVWWVAVGPQLTKQTPVWSSRVTVRLPETVSLGEVVLATNGQVEPAPAHSTDGREFVWQHGRFGAGEGLEVRLQVPPLVGAAPPSWQADDDRQRALEEADAARRSAATAVMAAAALAIAVGGGVGTYLLWYTRGRDPRTGVVPTYVAAPPDDLSPGAAGTLLDEQVDHRDVVAAIVDLGRRGVLTIREEPRMAPRGTVPDYRLTVDRVPAPLGALDEAILRAVFGRVPEAGASTHLSALGNDYRQEFPAITAALYRELVDRGYFPRPPTTTRTIWRKVALGVAGVGTAGGVAVLLAVGPIGFAVIGAALLLAAAGFRLARAMPRKTQAGADAAAQWAAFRRYLADIERHEDLGAARDIFERYLPYATAFGLDQGWVQKFGAVWTPAPDWYQSRPGDWSTFDWDFGTGHPSGAAPSSGPAPAGGGGSGGGPSASTLQLASNRTASGFQSSSSSLATFLNVAGTLFKVLGAFSGGGGSGGGFGGGGGGFH